MAVHTLGETYHEYLSQRDAFRGRRLLLLRELANAGDNTAKAAVYHHVRRALSESHDVPDASSELGIGKSVLDAWLTLDAPMRDGIELPAWGRPVAESVYHVRERMCHEPDLGVEVWSPWCTMAVFGDLDLAREDVAKRRKGMPKDRQAAVFYNRKKVR